MIEQIVPPPLGQMGPPLTSFRFLVTIIGVGSLPIPNLLDMRFQKVSGPSVQFESVDGSPNVRKNDETTNLPSLPKMGTLRLERGLIPGISPLRTEIELCMFDLEIHPKNILVMVLNQQGIPLTNWFYYKAVLRQYSLSDLDANQSGILIETMEFSYDKFQSISL